MSYSMSFQFLHLRESSAWLCARPNRASASAHAMNASVG